MQNSGYGVPHNYTWCGVVEDRKDPLRLGNVRVRIFGIHTEDYSILPTEALPWAQIIHPTTGPSTTGSLREGDYVYGFFQDGISKQIPVVLGVFSGVDNHVNIAGRKYTEKPRAFYDPRLQAQVEMGPRLPKHIVGRISGEPATRPRLSYGNLNGTGVQSTNSNITYSCDILGIVKMRTGTVYLLTTQLAQIVRKAIVALLYSAGSDPTGIFSSIFSFLKKINEIIQYIIRFVNEIITVVKLINQAISYARAIIKFITSLPAIIANQVRACLNNIISEFKSALGSALTFAAPDEIGQIVGSVQQLQSTFSDLEDTATATLNNAKGLTNQIQNFPSDLSTNTEQAVNSLTETFDQSISDFTATVTITTKSYGQTRPIKEPPPGTTEESVAVNDGD